MEVVAINGPGFDLASTGHDLAFYEAAKAQGKEWVALDVMSQGWDVDFKNALEAGLTCLFFQGYWAPAFSDPAEAISRANYGVDQLKTIGVPKGASLVLDFESVDVDEEEAILWVNAWSKAVDDAGYVPGIYVGVPQPISSANLYDALPYISHYWKSCSGSAADVAVRGYQIIQDACGQSIDGVAVDFDTATEDNLKSSAIGVMQVAKAVLSVVRKIWYLSGANALALASRQTKVPATILAAYNKLDPATPVEKIAVPMEVRVKSGDTLSGICARYGITDWENIAQINHINPNTLWVGQVIYL